MTKLIDLKAMHTEVSEDIATYNQIKIAFGEFLKKFPTANGNDVINLLCRESNLSREEFNLINAAETQSILNQFLPNKKPNKP